MRRAILLAATVLATVLAAVSGISGPASAQARGNAPWCVVISMGYGSVIWDCQYASIEACRPNVISGNCGFCNHNPAYVGPAEPNRRRAKRRAHR
jgi:hypothetical protein